MDSATAIGAPGKKATSLHGSKPLAIDNLGPSGRLRGGGFREDVEWLRFGLRWQEARLRAGFAPNRGRRSPLRVGFGCGPLENV